MLSNGIKKEIVTIAERYADLVKEEMHVESVYLFGSFVNNTNSFDSDIDSLTPYEKIILSLKK